MIAASLVTGLEGTRTNYDDAPIMVTGGYRCPHGNYGVGGVSNSFHTHGRAADIYSGTYTGADWTEQRFAELREAAAATGPVELLDWDSYADRHLHAAW